MPPASSPLARAVDFALRALFFLVAPLALIFAAGYIPLTGALVMIALALFVSLSGEAVRTAAERRPWLGRLLRRQLAFDAYYREHPPKPFAYYLFFPVLFPYWVTRRGAWRELYLYKGYTGVGVVLLVATSLYRFFHVWQPELGWRVFLPVLLKTVAIETAVVIAFLMPLTTTVVTLHGQRRFGALAVLLFVGGVSCSIALRLALGRHDPLVPFEARQRVYLRSEASPKKAQHALIEALRAAWKAQAGASSRVEGDGKLEGAALEAARSSLTSYYRDDEVEAFDLWASPRGRPKLMVLYTESRSGRTPLWVGLRDGVEVVRDPRQLPKGAFASMKQAER